jgi:hypothetical protein
MILYLNNTDKLQEMATNDCKLHNQIIWISKQKVENSYLLPYLKQSSDGKYYIDENQDVLKEYLKLNKTKADIVLEYCNAKKDLIYPKSAKDLFKLVEEKLLSKTTNYFSYLEQLDNIIEIKNNLIKQNLFDTGIWQSFIELESKKLFITNNYIFKL